MIESAVYLFVYGTLQPGFVNPFAQLLHRAGRSVGYGTMRGRIYLIGQYPGAIHAPDGVTRVHGTVFDITKRPGLLTHLDRYEGVNNPPTPADEYIRAMIPIIVESGTKKLFCWTYLYNRATQDSQQILSGRYSSQVV